MGYSYSFTISRIEAAFQREADESSICTFCTSYVTITLLAKPNTEILKHYHQSRGRPQQVIFAEIPRF